MEQELRFEARGLGTMTGFGVGNYRNGWAAFQLKCTLPSGYMDAIRLKIPIYYYQSDTPNFNCCVKVTNVEDSRFVSNSVSPSIADYTFTINGASEYNIRIPVTQWAGQTVYIYFTPGEGAWWPPAYFYRTDDPNNYSHHIQGWAEYHTDSPVGPPSNVTLSKTKAYLSDTITVRWNPGSNGINNPVKGYQVTLGTKSYTTQTNSFSIRVNELGIEKGNTVSCSVKTLGTLPGKDSWNVNGGSLQVVNEPPFDLSYSFNGVLSAANRKVTILNLSAKDRDNPSVSYCYCFATEGQVFTRSDGEKNRDNSLANNQNLVFPSNQDYLVVWAYDGQDYSEPLKKKPVYNSAPIIGNIVATCNKLPSQGGGPYATTISLSADVNKSVDYKWEVDVTGNNDYRTLSRESRVENLSLESLLEGHPNTQIKGRLRVRDSYQDTTYKAWTTNYFYPGEVPSIVWSNEPIITMDISKSSVNYPIGKEYFNRKIKATFNIDYPDSNYITLKSVTLLAKNSEVVTPVATQQLSTKGQKELVFESDFFDFGTSYQFAIRLEDMAGRSKDSAFTSRSYQRMPQIDLSKGSSSISREEWHVFEDEELKFATFYPTNGILGLITYHIYGMVNKEPFKEMATFTPETNSESISVSTSGNTITFTSKKPKELFEKLNPPGGQSEYPITYRIVAENAFGVLPSEEKVAYIRNKTLIAGEPPKLGGNLTVGVCYKNEQGQFKNASNNDQKNVINPGEYLNVAFSESAIDKIAAPAGKQKELWYKIDYRLSKTFTMDNEHSWEELKRFDGKNGIKSAKIQLPYISPDSNYLFIRGSAVNEVGRISNPLIVATPLLYSRKQKPNFSIKEVTISGQTVNMSLTVNDLGGNLTSSPYYDNFIRDGSENTWIKINYGNDPENLENEMVKTIITSTQNWDNISFALEGVSPSSKIFFQTTLIVSMNSINDMNSKDNTNTGFSPLYIYYTEGPTLSSRPHWIGINTDAYIPAVDDSLSYEVFQVSAFKNRNIVKFIGTNTISFNLTDGEASGMIIDGGTW